MTNWFQVLHIYWHRHWYLFYTSIYYFQAFEYIKLVQLQQYHKAPEDARDDIELDPLKIFHQAIDNCKPVLQTQNTMRGGMLYTVSSMSVLHELHLLYIHYTGIVVFMHQHKSVISMPTKPVSLNLPSMVNRHFSHLHKPYYMKACYIHDCILVKMLLALWNIYLI